MESPGYYEAVSRYYDDIFPLNPDTLTFLRKQAGVVPAQVLDIACGNASYAVALAEAGYLVEGFDLDAGMFQAAQAKSEMHGLTSQLRLLQGDMLSLDQLGLAAPDMAFCIGNSLVHLEGAVQVQAFLEKLHGLIRPQGRLVLQILNYDRILSNGITVLPVTKRADGTVLFERHYEYPTSWCPFDSQAWNQSDPVTFITRLHEEGEVKESRIPLYPLLSVQLAGLVESAGFTQVKCYGDFLGKEYQRETSYHLVMSAICC